MSEEDENEEAVSKAEWDAFWQSMRRYGTAENLRRDVFLQANELWADVSPRYAEREQAIVVVEDGEFRANMAGHVLIAAMSNAVAQSAVRGMFTENTLEILGEELRAQADSSDMVAQIGSQNVCEDCGQEFDPGMMVCPNCGEEL